MCLRSCLKLLNNPWLRLESKSISPLSREHQIDNTPSFYVTFSPVVKSPDLSLFIFVMSRDCHWI